MLAGRQAIAARDKTAKLENRNPKSEIRKKSEGRNPKRRYLECFPLMERELSQLAALRPTRTFGQAQSSCLATRCGLGQTALRGQIRPSDFAGSDFGFMKGVFIS
jgi:hypothetical protein